MSPDSIAAQLNNPVTSHQRRLEIGEQLANTGDTRPGIGLNDNGLPDIVWCPVSGGQIQIAGERIEFSEFQIAKYPITYSQYESFVRAEDGYENDTRWLDFPPEYHKQPLLNQNQKFSNHPRERLSWYQAVAFTRWLNSRSDNSWEIRLPYEWEWQRAAQAGDKNLAYPFGEWQENCANTAEAGLNRPIAVGMYPHVESACGAIDMAGNIWEWCLNDFEDIHAIDYSSGSKKVRRGGSYNFPKDFARNDNRDIVKPETRSTFNGMRLIRVQI